MIGMILAGGRGSRLYDLTKKLAKPAVYFGGKYRIIDFPLSNCANSNIKTVGVLVQYESVLLNSYVSRDHYWGLDMNDGGVYVLPPREKDDNDSGFYRGTADAITQNIDFLDQHEAEYVLVLSGDHIYKMDYEKMLEYHIKHEADATIAVLEVPFKEASRFGIMNVDDNDRITEFEEKPAQPKSNLASMGIYIFSYKKLRKFLKEDSKNKASSHDFGNDIIPTYLNNDLKLMAYRFKGYWKDVGTLKSLWQANMDLLETSSMLNLFDNDWKIYTQDVAAMPQYICEQAKVSNSFITQGCVIKGSIDHSVCFTSVYVDEGSDIKNSVVMTKAKIGKNCKLNHCIVDENVEIDDNMSFEGVDSDHIILVTKKLVSEKRGEM